MNVLHTVCVIYSHALFLTSASSLRESIVNYIEYLYPHCAVVAIARYVSLCVNSFFYCKLLMR